MKERLISRATRIHTTFMNYVLHLIWDKHGSWHHKKIKLVTSKITPQILSQQIK